MHTFVFVNNVSVWKCSSRSQSQEIRFSSVQFSVLFMKSPVSYGWKPPDPLNIHLWKCYSSPTFHWKNAQHITTTRKQQFFSVAIILQGQDPSFPIRLHHIQNIFIKNLVPCVRAERSVLCIVSSVDSVQYMQYIQCTVVQRAGCAIYHVCSVYDLLWYLQNVPYAM